MTLENLLIIVAVLVAAFVNIVLPALKKGREGGQAGEPQPGELDGRPTQTPAQADAEVDWPPMTPATTGPLKPRFMAVNDKLPFAAAMARPQASRPVPQPATKRRVLGNPADLRRAVVLRTVLGPCRAQQPFGSNQE